MADFTRRAFLKGTAKTILTGATIAAGGLSTTSTTPTVSKVATTFKNLNVLSPQAKAYRTFLRGMVTGVTQGNFGERRPDIKTILTKTKVYSPKKDAIVSTKTSYGRSAFESSIKKPEPWTNKKARDVYSAKHPARKGVGQLKYKEISNNQARNIAISMEPTGGRGGTLRGERKEIHHLTANITRDARQQLAKELRKLRKLNKKMKTGEGGGRGGRVGGGGKMALPGLESAKNPTGMSLITQRYTL